MERSFLVAYAFSYFLVLTVLWVFFFIYSHKRNESSPWGFVFVIAGTLVSGYGYAFYITNVGLFQINFLFLISIFGLLLNIMNIRTQLYIRNMVEFLRFLGIGLVFGLLFGFTQTALFGFENFHLNSPYIPIAIIASSIQVSIAEEILHRGFFLSFLTKYGFEPKYAVLFQSLMFAAAHVSRYSGNWAALCIAFLFGLVTNYFTWKDNNLISATILHLTANLIGILWWLAAK